MGEAFQSERGAPLGAGGGIKIDGSGVALPVTLPTTRDGSNGNQFYIFRSSAAPPTSVYNSVAAWTAAATGANGTSASLGTTFHPIVSGFGTVNGATTLTMQVSNDNATFYDTTTTQTLAGAGDFHLTLTTAAPFVRLKSSNNVTATATIAGKEN